MKQRHAAFTVLGPAAVGACLGMRFGLEPALTLALALPAILIGVTFATTPALYIGAAFAGIAPPAQELAGSVASGLRDAGLVYLGLTPAFLFLAASVTDPRAALLVGAMVIVLGAGLGLRLAYGRLFEGKGARFLSLPLFCAWAIVCVGIAAHLLGRVV